MDTQVFDFNEQLGVGNAGEADFRKFYAELKPTKSQDRRFDFYILDGKTVELKTDTYDMGQTGNFFMELFGNASEGKMGGPWRAMQDGVDFFVYYFPKNRTFFWFRTVELCSRLDALVAQMGLKPKEIKNRTWSTLGYTIPREMLVDIEYKNDIF